MQESVTTEKTEPSAELTAEVKKSCFGKISAFFDKNFALFFTPLIVLALYFFTSWVYDVYPFSDKYTAASYDYSAQICPFFDHIFDVLKGKSTLSYTYSVVGGADVTGMLLYTFVSPFSVLFLFAGEGNVVYMAVFVVAFKLAAVGFAGAWFVRKLFKNIPEYLAIAIGVLYAFCGYSFVASTFVAWLDLLIYAPFCVGAFCHFVKTGSFWRFSLLLALCIYAHFSIACFAFLTVFPALIAYALFCVEKERRYKFIASLCVAFFLAVVMALPILIPALSAFLRSSRAGGLFDKVWFGYDLSAGTLKSAGKNTETFIGRFEESFYKKGSYIIADGAFLVLTVIWFFRNGLKSPMAKFMLTAGVLTLLPVFIDESMLLLNMGSYLSYSLRFGVLNSLYFMGGACLCLNELCYKKGCAYDGTPLGVGSGENGETGVPVSQTTAVQTKKFKLVKRVTKRELGVWKGVLICVCVVAAAILTALAVFSWFINSGEPAAERFYEKYGHVDFVWYLRNLPGVYAHSEGGVELVAVPFFTVLAVLLFGGGLAAWKRTSVRLLSVLLVVVLGVQTVYTCGLLVEGNRSQQHYALEDYKKMSATIGEREGDTYYRTKDFGRLYYNDEGEVRMQDVWSSCVAFPGETNSFTVFSSIVDADNYTCRRLFGYLGGSATFKSEPDLTAAYRADYFADCFLGYKYVYVPNNGDDDVKIRTKDKFENEELSKLCAIRA